MKRWTIIDPIPRSIAVDMPIDYPIWKDENGAWWGERLGSSTWLRRTSRKRLEHDLTRRDYYEDDRRPYLARVNTSGWWSRGLR